MWDYQSTPRQVLDPFFISRCSCVGHRMLHYNFMPSKLRSVFEFKAFVVQFFSENYMGKMDYLFSPIARDRN